MVVRRRSTRNELDIL